MFSIYKYCYMRSILVDSDDKTRAFSLVLSNEDFTRVGIYNTDLKGLIVLNNSDNLIKDFSIEDNYLKCSEVLRVPLTSNDTANFNRIIEVQEEFEIFSDFLRYGSDNNFYLIPEEIAMETHYLGNSMTAFNKIEFSRSTMTVYARMMTDNQIKNQMLVIMQDQNLEIVPFYFITDIDFVLKTEYSDYVEDLGIITINNLEYRLFKFNNMPLYPTMTLKVNSLINKAMTLSIKQKNLIDIVKDCKALLKDMLGYKIEDKKFEWVGGSNSYKSTHGVYFKSNLMQFSKEGRTSILNSYISYLEQHNGDAEAIKSSIDSEDSNHMRKLALYTIHNVMTSDKDLSQVLLNCDEIINGLNKSRIHCEAYLYKVRLFSYFTGNRLATKANPIITGSDEEAYTIVEQKLLYGME